ncbi:hypothetical protein V6574_32910 [Streptomyces sp. SM1P]
MLGRSSDRLPSGAARLATALDELYGAGHGEGSRGGLPGRDGSGAGGGREPSFPGVREWSEELTALFGPGVREEVLAAAAVTGRQDVLAELDPAAATPPWSCSGRSCSTPAAFPKPASRRSDPWCVTWSRN